MGGAYRNGQHDDSQTFFRMVGFSLNFENSFEEPQYLQLWLCTMELVDGEK